MLRCRIFLFILCVLKTGVHLYGEELATDVVIPVNVEEVFRALTYHTVSVQETTENSNQQRIYMPEIESGVGNLIEVVFSTGGWIFLGYLSMNDRSNNPGLSFSGKKLLGEDSKFTFETTFEGNYTLIFQYQDNITGFKKELLFPIAVRRKTAEETLTIHAISQSHPEEITPDVPLQASSQKSSEASNKENVLQHAERLFHLKEYRAALKEFLRNYREHDAYLNDRIASVYYLIDELDSASKYWQINFNTSGVYHDRAVKGMMKVALALEDGPAVVDYLTPLLDITATSIEEELISLARFQISRDEIALPIKTLTEYLKRYPEGKYVDEVLYLLGSLQEKISPLQDITKSKQFYYQVFREFPESKFSNQSYNRYRYLIQHFFVVR